jgi:hypothetical protein
MALRLRRGSNADRLLITPLEGELVYATDSKLIYIGDGATVGGVLVGVQALGSNLNLAGNDIVGTGNINITGTITASGDINLGDGVGGDTIGIQGNITSNLLPNVDSNYNIGSGSLRWNNIFSTGVDVGGQINAETINSNIVADDSTISYNKASNTFNGVFDGDLSGSVFGDDSTALVDAVNNHLSASQLTAPVIASPTPTAGISFNTQDEPSRFILQRNSDSAIAGTTPVGRLIFGYKIGDAAAVTITSISVTNDQLSFIPQPGGTPDYNNYMKLYKTGTVQISRAGEISNAPGDAKLEVGGAVLYEPMTTTVRDALTAAAGMVIFNTTDTKLQVYDGSSWINLH